MSYSRILKDQEINTPAKCSEKNEIHLSHKKFRVNAKSLPQYYRYLSGLLSIYNTISDRIVNIGLPRGVLLEFKNHHLQIQKMVTFLEDNLRFAISSYKPSNLITEYNQLLSQSYLYQDQFSAHLYHRLSSDIFLTKIIYDNVTEICKLKSFIFDDDLEKKLTYQSIHNADIAYNILETWFANYEPENPRQFQGFITEAKLWQDEINAVLNETDFSCKAINSTSVFTMFALTVGSIGSYAIHQMVNHFSGPR
jgi:hypothetical protein